MCVVRNQIWNLWVPKARSSEDPETFLSSNTWTRDKIGDRIVLWKKRWKLLITDGNKTQWLYSYIHIDTKLSFWCLEWTAKQQLSLITWSIILEIQLYHSTTSGTSWVNDRGGELSDIWTHLLAVWVDTSTSLFLTTATTVVSFSSVWQLISCFLTPFLVIGSFEEEQVVQIVWDLLHTIGTLSLTSMEPVSKKGVYYRNSLTISAIELRVFESHPKCLILDICFVSFSFLSFLKIQLQVQCKLGTKWDFQNQCTYICT